MINKSVFTIGIFLLLAASYSCESQQEEFSVMSFNIRYANQNDAEDYWEFRKEQVVDLMNESGCGFIGVQEALPDQIDYLSENLADYGVIWRTRETDPNRGEAVPLFYAADRWDLLDSETFWLSDQPEIPGSNTWNAACNRVATWGRFVSRESGRTVVVCNTHFDHIAQEARWKGSALIIRRMDSLAAGYPVVLLGDLNGRPDNPAILTLTRRFEDPYPTFFPDDTISGTYHGFTGNPEGKRIDYVLISPAVEAKAIQILRNHDGGRYPSDHFPVYAVLVF